MNENPSKTIVDPKIKDMQERAKIAQKQARELRKQAPDISLKSVKMSIPQKDLMAQYAKADGTQGPDAKGGFHYMFGDRDLSDQYPDMGYEPVIERGLGGTVKQVTWQGDPMWKIPTDVYQARLEDNAQRAMRVSASESHAQTQATNRSGVMEETFQTAAANSVEADKIMREAGVD